MDRQRASAIHGSGTSRAGGTLVVEAGATSMAASCTPFL
jgi:hypothetical protein